MNHRYDFVFLFDCTDANPNGDPDAGNLPRVDTETGQGLGTDVCIKRKIRDYFELTGMGRVYVKSRAILNNQNNEVWEQISPTTPIPKRKDRHADENVADELRLWMCKNFRDIRTFGAVMTNEINCGQVRADHLRRPAARRLHPAPPIDTTRQRRHPHPPDLIPRNARRDAEARRRGLPSPPLASSWTGVKNRPEHSTFNDRTIPR